MSSNLTPGRVANQIKHGIDFDTVRALWLDDRLLQIRARSTDEARWLVIGRLQGKHWSAVITRRGDKIRIISVRRARTSEVALYESEAI